MTVVGELYTPLNVRFCIFQYLKKQYFICTLVTAAGLLKRIWCRFSSTILFSMYCSTSRIQK